MLTKRCFQRRQMRLDHVPNSVGIHSEVLVNKDVPEPADLGPRDLWMRVGDLRGEMDDGFADDLQVSFNGIFGHVDEVAVLACQGT
nr:hypothetical protein [Microbacterium sp. SD291]